jgi:formamidopyrimidine-DNA glycosylase
MFNGAVDVSKDQYLIAAAGTTLANAYRVIRSVKLTQVVKVGSTVIATVQAVTEHGTVQENVQVDSSIYQLACRRCIEMIPEAEFVEV